MKRSRSDDQGSFQTAQTSEARILVPSVETVLATDFDEIGRQFPAFGRARQEFQQAQAATPKGRYLTLSSGLTQDFSIGLTKALLKIHFGVSLCRVPEKHLCPPIPNRYFLVHWLRTNVLPLACFRQPPPPPVPPATSFLDIGTGPTAVYALLLAATFGYDANVQIYATDIDLESIECALLNVAANPHLQAKIKVQSVATTTGVCAGHGPLRQSLHALNLSTVDVCLTNPPFFDTSSDERTAHRRGDQRERTPMTVSEGTYDGGEVAFVTGIFVDTLQLNSPPRWNACMCGKKSSWMHLKQVCEQVLGYGRVTSVEFGPGHMTRWFLSWTTLHERPLMQSPLAQTDAWSSFLIDGCDLDDAVQRVTNYSSFTKPALSVLERIDTTNSHRRQMLLQEAHPTVPSWLGDDALPEPVLQVVNDLGSEFRMNLLPVEGHFQIVLILQAVPGQEKIQMDVHTFAHTRYGKTRLGKMKTQLPGELQQTNRRWRRLLKREAQLLKPEGMDTSS